MRWLCTVCAGEGCDTGGRERAAPPGKHQVSFFCPFDRDDDARARATQVWERVLIWTRGTRGNKEGCSRPGWEECSRLCSRSVTQLSHGHHIVWVQALSLLQLVCTPQDAHVLSCISLENACRTAQNKVLVNNYHHHIRHQRSETPPRMVAS